MQNTLHYTPKTIIMKINDKVTLSTTSIWVGARSINKDSENPLNVDGIIISYRDEDKKDDGFGGDLHIGVKWDNGIVNHYNHKDLIIKKQTTMSTKQTMKTAVQATADALLAANNTVTTLEIKVKLRKDEPNFYWSQANVSQIMDELQKEGKYIYSDNGTFRVYSDTKAPAKAAATVKGLKKGSATALAAGKKAAATRAANKGKTIIPGARISRTKALDLIKNNKGHFFTAVFTKVDGTERTMNAQYLKDQGASGLGYVKVREASKLKADPNDSTRQINMQTLKRIKIGGIQYIVK